MTMPDYIHDSAWVESIVRRSQLVCLRSAIINGTISDECWINGESQTTRFDNRNLNTVRRIDDWLSVVCLGCNNDGHRKGYCNCNLLAFNRPINSLVLFIDFGRPISDDGWQLCTNIMAQLPTTINKIHDHNREWWNYYIIASPWLTAIANRWYT